MNPQWWARWIGAGVCLMARGGYAVRKMAAELAREMAAEVVREFEKEAALWGAC